MKKLFVLASVLVLGSCLVFASAHHAQAVDSTSTGSRLLAQEVGNQDPDSPDFAPGEKADGSIPDAVTTPTVTATATKTTSTTDNPTKEEILDMTRNDDSGGVGILGALLTSPIVSMIVYFIGFLIFAGIIVLIIVLIVRGNRKANKQGETPKQSGENTPNNNK